MSFFLVFLVLNIIMNRNYKSILLIIKILRKLKKEEMEYFISNLNEKNRELICEIIFNLMYNVNTLKLTKHKLSKVRKIILPVKKDFSKLAEKNVCGNIKNRIIKKQNGNRIISAIFGIVLPSIISSLVGKK